MSVPKKRRTKSSVGNRRSHQALKSLNLTICPQCGREIEPHTACFFCGYYRGQEVVKVKSKKKKKN
jgi:large subunit ribosomal protein L32